MGRDAKPNVTSASFQ